MNKDIKTALFIVGVIFILLIALPAIFGLLVGGFGGGWGMMGSGMMGGFGWWWLLPVLAILFLALIIWAIVMLMRGLSQPGHSQPEYGSPDSALEILKQRYAKGEINKEEYEEKKKDLSS